MANLTTNLATPNAPNTAIRPEAQGPSVLGGLAELVGDVAGVFNFRQQRRANQQKADQVAVANKQAEDKANAENAIANIFFEVNANTPEKIPAVIPPSIVSEIGGLERLSKATERGQLSGANLELRVETLVSRVLKEFPEQSANIFKYMKESGLDNIYARTEQATLDAEDAERKARTENINSNASYAVSIGVDPNLPTDILEKIGRNSRALDYELKMKKDQFDREKASTVFTQEQQDRYKQETDEVVVLNEIGIVNTVFNTRVQEFNNIAVLAQSDPRASAALSEMGPAIQNWVSTNKTVALNRARKNGASAKGLAEISKYYDNQAVAFKEMYSGELGLVQSNVRAFNTLQSATKLEAAKALPIYNSFVNMFGREQANEIIEKNVLTPELIKSLADEAKGFVPGAQGNVSLMNIAAALRGKTDIVNLTPKESAQVMKTISATNGLVTKGVLSGDTTYTKQFITTQAQVANAVVDTIIPSTTDVTELANAASLTTAPNVLAALDRVAQTPEGQYVVVGSRGAAVRILDSAKAQIEKNKPNKYQTIRWQGGRFAVAFDVKAFEKDFADGVPTATGVSKQAVSAKAGNEFGLAPQTKEQRMATLNRVDKNLSSLANTMNQSVEHLTKTSKYVDEWENVKDESAIREFWATGSTAKLPKGPDAPAFTQKPVNALTAVNEFTKSLVRDTAELQTNPDTEIANTKLGFGEVGSALKQSFVSSGVDISDVAVAGIVGNLAVESTLNPSIINPDDGGKRSIGLSQWRGPRDESLRAFAKSKGVDWTDLNVQTEYLVQELQQDYPKVFRQLQEAETPEEAANIFAKGYLVPRGANQPGYDNIIDIGKRRSNARKAYGR